MSRPGATSGIFWAFAAAALDPCVPSRHGQASMTMTVGTVVLALALLVAPLVSGADAQAPLSNYAVTSWADRDGVPIGTVYAIAQDHSGYLWLGTAGGLVRFDGLRFSPAADVIRGALPSSAVGAVSVMADGSLLVGFVTGEVRRIRGVELLPVAEPEHTLGRIDAVVEDRTGTIWAIADGRAYRQRDRRFEVVAIGSPTPRVVNAYVAPDRTLYLATGRGLFRQTGTGAFQQLSYDFVYAASQGRGELWVTHPLYGFVRASDSMRDAALIGNGYRAIHDRDGSLWVATIGKGLWRVQIDPGTRPGRIRVAPFPALPDDSAQALFEDREGNIWVGTPTGLHRLTRKPLAPIVNAGPILTAEATTEGSGVWAGTLLDGLIRFVREGDGWRRTVHSPRNVVIRSLHRDVAGTLWIGTNAGLARLVDDRLQFVTRPAGAPQIAWLTSDIRGALWLGDGRRLFQFSGDQLSEVKTWRHPQPVAFAVADRQGRLWVALGDGTIQAIDSQGNARGVGSDGLATTHRVVYCIFEDIRGDVWFGASDGLHRYAGDRLSTVTLSSDWPENQVWAIVEDDQRFLWLNTDLGVLRIHPDELMKATADPGYRMHYRVFDGHDGLGGASVEYLRAARGSNGTLWFSRGGVLTAVDPGALPSTDQIARNPVRIESVTTEQGPFDLRAGGALAAGTRRLDVNFSVLHLSPAPRLRFRHRLEGFESDWRDAGTRPVASYTNLSPGAYRLVVEAFSTEGPFGSAAVWEFRVPPTLSQSPTFRATTVLAAGLIVGLAWWMRTRIVRRQFAAVLAERARVSREIHDTLLQGVVGIGLQLDHLEQSQTGDPAENARRFQRLRLLLEGYVREARRSILDLRAPSLERRSFEDALNDIGARLTANTNIQFMVTVKGKPRGCSARMENELLRIAHEAIANAVRHSSANSIQVQLRFEDAWVALRVTDDGCGFNVERVATASPPQFGLVSMKERAKMLGGELRVETAAHRGTDVEAVLPVRVAS